MKNKPLYFITLSAAIAAVYAALTILLAPVSFASIQFRLAESLNVLCCITPAAIPGMVVGCILGNLASPLGILDMILGPVATLIACVTAYMLRKIKIGGFPVFAAISPALFNGILVGVLECAVTPQAGFVMGFLVPFISVFISEIVVCTVLGIPLYFAAQKVLGNKLSLK